MSRWLVLLLGGLLAAPAGAATIELNNPSASPGSMVTVIVGLEAGTAAVASFEHEISYDGMRLRLNFHGSAPDCSLSPALGKQLDVIPFGDGSGFRARILSVSDPGPILDGPVYFCTLLIDPATPEGNYPLTQANASARAPDGTEITGVELVDGVVTVLSGAAVEIAIGNVRGAPGGLVSVPVSLTANGSTVARTENEISFEPTDLRVHFISEQPDCAENPLTGKRLSASVRGDGASLDAELVPVLGFGSIPDGELYHCTFEIDAAAEPGVYDLMISGVAAYDSEDRRLPQVAGVSGSVTAVFPACTGDCDLDGEVAINDLLLAVNIALGLSETGRCIAIDADGDRTVAITELVQAVQNALSGCP